MKKAALILFNSILFTLLTVNVNAQDNQAKESKPLIKRYLVERSFPDGLAIPTNEKGCEIVSGVVSNNAEELVTWVHSYVTADKKKTFCIYDAPSPEAIRKVAEKNGLPVDNITEVTVLDPYFYN